MAAIFDTESGFLVRAEPADYEYLHDTFGVTGLLDEARAAGAELSNALAAATAATDKLFTGEAR